MPRLSWVMPVEMLAFAALLALVIGWPRQRWPASLGRVTAEAFAIGDASLALWAAVWAPFWWVVQH
jgi:hypothetical protein